MTNPEERPVPSAAAQNLVVVVLDSLRYDSWLAADPVVLRRLGPVERRWSYASWTAPSHYNLLMGLLPHSNPTHVYASDYYKEDFERYSERLGIPGIDFRRFLPTISLPHFLRSSLGYRTHALVSMPVLNPYTPINCAFDTYHLMARHNDMAGMIEMLSFEDGARPAFYLLNVGETHYPYSHPGGDDAEWPHLTGVHGVMKTLTGAPSDGGGAALAPGFFSASQLEQLRKRQIAAVTYLDGVFERLFELLPRNTWVIVTSDHGELFGEDGFFGHGPIAHEKVLEVPFVEGLVP